MNKPHISIEYISLSYPDYLQDHHNREGECLIGIFLQQFSHNEEIYEAFIDELNSCAHPDDFPWKDIEEEAKRFFADFSSAEDLSNEYIQHFLSKGQSPEDEDFLSLNEGEDLPSWYFVIHY